jgi:uncharacterized membrane protein
MPQIPARVKHRSANVVLWPFLGLLVAAAVIVSLATNQYSLLSAWRTATTHRPETFTELYFDTPNRLPRFAPPKKPQTIAFHIVNHEHTVITYQYEVSVMLPGAAKISYHLVRLGDGQGAAETMSFTIPKPNQSALITIRLVGRSEQLNFRSAS